MDEKDIAKKVQQMTRQQQETRLAELNAKLGVTSPHSVTDRDPVPPTQDIEELFEREYLKEALGYSS
jgi:hypothetical protein